MKIYLAAKYDRNDEMRGVRDVLEAIGYEVTSHWIDQHDGELTQSAAVSDRINTAPDECWRFAEADLIDLAAADLVLSFTSREGGGTGGRHVEFGYAMALGRRVAIVGPRENVFHTLRSVLHFPTWSAFLTEYAIPNAPRLPWQQT